VGDGNLLVRIGLAGKRLSRAQMPPRNLVFLVDVSGSMADTNKLPLLKKSLGMLAETLTPSGSRISSPRQTSARARPIVWSSLPTAKPGSISPCSRRLAMVLALAGNALGADRLGHRKQFLALVARARDLAASGPAAGENLLVQ
jgi:hypothetical protein